MGRIPHFQATIFPKESLPFLNLIATLGLIFFLFQVGLEVDLRIVKRDWKQSVSIAFAGMALPFGLGAAVSVGLYKLQNENDIPFSSFVLFLGVAMAITVSIHTSISKEASFNHMNTRLFLSWLVYWQSLNYCVLELE
jgi:Kef-type K+ transport system membrane component KefB